MSSKIFASPGISARKLNLFEKFVELVRDYRYGYRTLAPNLHLLRRKLFPSRGEREIQELLKALESGHYNGTSSLAQGSALVVEDLASTMESVVYKDSDIKL